MGVRAFLDSVSLLVKRGFGACTLIDAEMVARMGVAALGRVALALGDARGAVVTALAGSAALRSVGLVYDLTTTYIWVGTSTRRTS